MVPPSLYRRNMLRQTIWDTGSSARRLKQAGNARAPYARPVYTTQAASPSMVVAHMTVERGDLFHARGFDHAFPPGANI